MRTLFEAARAGDIRALDHWIVQKNHDINQKDPDGMTPFLLAAKYADCNTLKWLVAHGADTTIKSSERHSAFYYVAFSHAGTLQEKQAKIDYLFNLKFIISVNIKLVFTNNLSEIISQHQKDPTYIKQFDLEYDCGLLHAAAAHGNQEIAVWLISKGIACNTRNKAGWTPLHFAAYNGQKAMVQWLLQQQNIDCNEKTLVGSSTPLHLAAENGHTEVMLLLIDYFKADPEMIDYYGWTPLYRAAENGHVEAAKLCLARSKKSSKTEETRWTPLHFATFKGHYDVVRCLAQEGINPDAKNSEGKTALQIAQENGYNKIFEYLQHFRKLWPKENPPSQRCFVIIRVWLPKTEINNTRKNARGVTEDFSTRKDTLSMPLAFATRAFGGEVNIGHISIFIKHDNEEYYLSHWPKDQPKKSYIIVPGENRTFRDDIESERGLPDESIILYSLDTARMIEHYNSIREKQVGWYIGGSKKSDDNDENKSIAHSCSSFVYEFLEYGSIFEYLLLPKDQLIGPMTPKDVANLATKAKFIEDILYPETQDFFRNEMLNFTKKLLEISQKEGDLGVKGLMQKYPDYYKLWAKGSDNAIQVKILKEVSDNNQAYATKELHKIMQDTKNASDPKLSSYVEEYISFKATLNFICDRGYNALHWAIVNKYVPCVKKLIETFPEAVNSEIQYLGRTEIKGLSYVANPGTGHCLCKAVAIYMGVTDQYLRQKAAAYLDYNRESFKEFLTLSDKSDQCISDIRYYKESDPYIEIEILMRALNRPIFIINEDNNITNPKDRRRSKFSGEPIFVYDNGHNHYHAFSLKDGASGREILQNLGEVSQAVHRSASPSVSFWHDTSTEKINDNNNTNQPGLSFSKKAIDNSHQDESELDAIQLSIMQNRLEDLENTEKKRSLSKEEKKESDDLRQKLQTAASKNENRTALTNQQQTTLLPSELIRQDMSIKKIDNNMDINQPKMNRRRSRNVSKLDKVIVIASGIDKVAVELFPPPISALDLAIDIGDEQIINLLVQGGAVTKNREQPEHKLSPMTPTFS